MNIYIPYYNWGEWHVQVANVDEVRKLGSYWEWRGTVYGPTAYKTEEGAMAYIGKRYADARRDEYNA